MHDFVVHAQRFFFKGERSPAVKQKRLNAWRAARPLPYFRGGEELFVCRVQRHLSLQRWFFGAVVTLAVAAPVSMVFAAAAGGPAWSIAVVVSLWILWFIAVAVTTLVVILAPRVELKVFERIDS
jgi:hypothetical protein